MTTLAYVIVGVLLVLGLAFAVGVGAGLLLAVKGSRPDLLARRDDGPPSAQR